MIIKIEERTPQKMPGLSSLFISFSYKQEVVEFIKTTGTYDFNKDTKEWEVPITSLSQIIDGLCVYGDIEFRPLHIIEPTPIEYKLQEYKTQPFKHQLEAIQYGLNHSSWLLLDAPGLGKTLSMICLAQELKQRENINHVLIICGLNSLKTNWKLEIQKHSNLSCKILGERVNRKGKIVYDGVQKRLEELQAPIQEFFVITNIETLRNDNVLKAINSEKHNKFDMVILDEFHVCKSTQSQQGKNLLKIKKPKRKIGLSGTMIVNKPTDAFVPLKWIGIEHSNASTFKYYYCNYAGEFNHTLLGYKNLTNLQYEVEKNSLRRTKDILDLPPKIVIHEDIVMDDDQREFYDNIKNGIVEQVNKVQLTPGNVLSMITRLRQATSCPTALTSENISIAKIDRAVDLSEQVVSNGNKVVIFSWFKETLNQLFIRLKEYNPVICTGDQDLGTIDKNIANFQTNPDCKIMLATTKKIGAGRTLNAASYMIFIDSNWTEAQNTQCEDRIHRIGSKDTVFIYYLWANNTFDYRVKELVETKEILGDYIVDDLVVQDNFEKFKSLIQDL